MSSEFLPIRVVKTTKEFYAKKVGGGGEPKFFIEDEKIREHMGALAGEIDKIGSNLKSTFDEFPDIPPIIKANLKKDALAKSHRPKKLLNEETCPIVGVDDFGELFLKATKTGLAKLKEKISAPRSKYEISNITTIDEIEEFSKEDKLGGLKAKQIFTKSLKKGVSCLKAILFDYRDEHLNQLSYEKFEDYIKKLELKVENISKIENFNLFRITGAEEEDIEKIAKYPSLKKISFFPKYRKINPKRIVFEGEKLKLLKPDSSKEYPRVGILDSGIFENNPLLKDWILYRKNFIPPEYADNSHGTFVGGLICMGNEFNGEHICPNKDFVKLVDLNVIPDKASSEELSEDDLIIRIQDSIPEILKKFGDIRIWNMSLGFDLECNEINFSDLGIFLDKFQDQYNIIFVLPSGNYTNLDQNTWPPTDALKKNKLQIPSDSARAITVGAIACSQKIGSLVNINEPTSYSCRGPGPSFITKPELAHYSGNLSIENGSLSCEGQGIKSIGENGELVEDAGTSFSAPLVSRSLGIIHNQLAENSSNELIKALAVHNSKIPQNLNNDEKTHSYVGYGVPSKVNDIFSCSPHECTLIFEQEAQSGFNLDYPFIWPESLVDENGKCRGNVTMTLVAKTPLDENFGSEYIRTNVSAALQCMNRDKEDKEIWSGKVHESPDPCDLNKCYESEVIEHGYKWKPVKKYEKNFHGVAAEKWRIRVNLLLRDSVVLENPVKFALIFTISDPKNEAPIYSEVVTSLRAINLITNTIELRNRAESRVEIKQ